MSQGNEQTLELLKLHQATEIYDFITDEGSLLHSFAYEGSTVSTDWRNRYFKMIFDKTWQDFEFAGDPNDANKLVDVAEQAFLNLEEWHPDRNKWLQKLIGAMIRRLIGGFDESNQLGEVEVIIALSKLLTALSTGNSHFAHLKSVEDMLSCLKAFVTRETEDFAAADQQILESSAKTIALDEDTASQFDPISREWMRSHCMLGRYRSTGDLRDLEDAINMVKGVADSVRRIPPTFRIHLSRMLSERYLHIGNINDINEAIRHAHQAINECSRSEIGFSWMLDKFCAMLLHRWQRLGRVEDLNLAIDVSEEARDLLPSMEIRKRAHRMVTLGETLALRSEAIRSAEDIDRAVRLTEAALDDLPEVSEMKADYLAQLGSLYFRRYPIRRETSDLVKAESILISVAQKKIREGEEISRGLAEDIIDVAFLKERDSGFQQLVNVEEIMSRIYADEKKRDNISAHVRYTTGISMYFRYLNYDDSLEIQSWMPEKDKILREAVGRLAKSLSLVSEDHPDELIALNAIGGCYMEQYWCSKSSQDLDAALGPLTAVTRKRHATPYLRIHAARRAIILMIDAGMFEEAAQLASEAMKVLPEVCSRVLSREDQQSAAQIPGLVSDACGLALSTGDVEEALARAEFGRCMTLGYLMDSRSDLTELKNKHPVLAKEYDRLRSKAFQQVDKSEIDSISERDAKHRQKAVRELDDLEEEIRKYPGFERFLQPPTVEDCQEAAIEGPIILVNMTCFRADAIIVTADQIQHIELNEMLSGAPTSLLKRGKRLRGDSIKRTSNIGEWLAATEEHEIFVRTMFPRRREAETDIAEWLWRTCVKLVLEKLPSTPETPRIWWMGMDMASSLPFHAAGIHGEGRDPSEDCLTRTISSYTPTIKALRYARNSRTHNTQSFSELTVLVTSMLETPNENPLPGVVDEEKAIREMIQTVQLRQPSSKEVLQAIKQHQIAHFACHGSSDLRDPSESHLLLQGKDHNGNAQNSVDKLTVSALLDSASAGTTWIAYLSACSTAQIRATSLQEENIHLASAFQVAGFKHVIASLWATEDPVCVMAAKSFYGALAQLLGQMPPDRAVAEALRTAVIDIRERNPSNFNAWAPYIHLGA